MQVRFLNAIWQLRLRFQSPLFRIPNSSHAHKSSAAHQCANQITCCFDCCHLDFGNRAWAASSSSLAIRSRIQ